MAVKKEKKKKKAEKKLTWQQNLVMSLHDFLYMLTVLLILLLIVFRVIVVSGDSMFSTLWDGDYLLFLSSVVYHDPQPGDIVVINKQSFDIIVKRVIATEGQTVDIDFENGIVYVDGEALEEPYIHNLTNREEGVTFPVTVAEGHIFVLGDNRAVSMDSRNPTIGQIDKREVLGKAIYLMIPGTDGDNRLPRDFDRIGAIR